MLEIKHLTAAYGDRIVFEDRNLVIANNEIVSLVGPSGGGKSTFLNCINRFILDKGGSFRGEIRLNGVDTVTFSDGELRKRICTVFQDARPFPLSIEKNIHYVLDYYGALDRAEKTEELLRRVGLFDEVKDKLRLPAASLSGGQKQRLCIARALATAPDVLLLDEPSASLDPANTRIIEELIQDLSARHSILFVTHNLEQAARIAHRTVAMGIKRDRSVMLYYL
ncbi:Phosphate import ATP-binding protein PstB 3 [Aedoeadaptatus ivorii]|uniref:Phosphate import ATP-binding protein PstB 3 n=1 Tax=Aedoeadaptatus ivorii TaxID=54006 RepID=A0A3S4Y6E9_9FIRM|nr:phosphate ABC transporter ATP-binding protein [Peptoniphilus ivorii]VEJ34723.1 Phosphate import ATP-binding protein PstB 3 [Peptoniphilus ivorii]